MTSSKGRWSCFDDVSSCPSCAVLGVSCWLQRQCRVASVMDFQGTLFLFRFDLKLLATVQTDFSDACDVRKPSSDRSTTVLEGVVPCIRFASCSSEAVCSIGSISCDFSIPFGAFLFIYIFIETGSKRTGRSTIASQFSFHLQSCFFSQCVLACQGQASPGTTSRPQEIATFCVANARGGSLLMDTGIRTCSRSSFIFVNHGFECKHIMVSTSRSDREEDHIDLDG